MPSCKKIKPRLGRELRQFLQDFEETKTGTEDFKDSVSDMILWVLGLGGIAATLTEHRRWFPDHLRTRLYKNQIGREV